MALTFRPEPLAWPFAGLLLVLVVGAAQYANNLGFFFAFWLAASAGVSVRRARRQLHGLQVHAFPPASAFEGEHPALPLQLHGMAGVELEATLGGNGPWQAVRMTTDPVPLLLPLPATGRGAYGLPALRLQLRDALGLVRWAREEPLTGRYWVYPAPRGERPLPPAGGGADGPPPAGMSSAQPSSRSGQEDFAGLNRYQPGDAPARIHWRALARQGVLQTKQFAGEAPPHGPRRLDERLLLELPREVRLSQLAAWVLACEAAGEPYVLSLVHGPALAAGCGVEQRTQALRLLAEAPSA